MKTILTIGTFDLFHYGHLELFKKCKKIADKVIVSLNTDEFVKEYKGKLPILSYEERKKSILGCKYVDEVVPNIGGKDSKPVILSVKPDFLCVGSDWAQKDKNYLKQIDATLEWFEEQNIVLLFVNYTEAISTTEIKQRILNQ